MLDKLAAVAGDDEKATRAAERGHKQAAYIVRVARGTGAELQELLLKGVVPALLRLALTGEESAAKAWAGKMLGGIAGGLEKYDKKLYETNAAYLKETEKIRKEKQLAQVVVSPGPIMEAVQRELPKAEDARRALIRLKGIFGRGWKKQLKNDRNLKDYLGFVGLPDFPKSPRRWWTLLWPLIKKNNPGLLEKLRGGGFPTRGIRQGSRWATYRPEFRKALGTLARLRKNEVL